jgi:hypothetical protein
MVKSKKKKAVKSKSFIKLKEKTKRRTKKVSKKKFFKRGRVSMEDLYLIFNKAQLGGKKITFTIALSECPTVENMIRDAEIKYEKVEMKTQAVFTLFPSEKEIVDEAVLKHLEIYEDEDEDPNVGMLFP